MRTFLLHCQRCFLPNAGSDLASLQCRADVDGDAFVLNGQKIWTSDAYHADWGILLARTDRNAPKHQGISCIMVDMRQPGIEVRRLKQISGNQEFCEVFFTNVRIVADNLVGEMNAGWRIAQTTLSYERSSSTLGHVARLQKMFERMIAVCTSLKRNGTPALEDPNVRQKLGEIYAEIEVLRFAALRLLSRLEKGLRPGPEASIAKLHAAVAPLEASSAERVRHRVNRGGNRRLNAILYRIAVTQARRSPPARAYPERRTQEGKTRREALRALKRYIVRAIWRQWRQCHPACVEGAAALAT